MRRSKAKTPLQPQQWQSEDVCEPEDFFNYCNRTMGYTVFNLLSRDTERSATIKRAMLRLSNYGTPITADTLASETK